MSNRLSPSDCLTLPWLQSKSYLKVNPYLSSLQAFPIVPSLPIVFIDPENDHNLIVRLFRQEHSCFITGWIKLPDPVNHANISEAQTLFKEIELTLLNSRYEIAHDKAFHTRPRDSKEPYDILCLTLSCPDSSLAIDISYNFHPDRKYINSVLCQNRLQSMIDSVSCHIGHFLVHGNWHSRDTRLSYGNSSSDSSSAMDSDSSNDSTESDYDYFYDEIIMDNNRFPKDRAIKYLNKNSVDFHINILHGLCCKLTEF